MLTHSCPTRRSSDRLQHRLGRTRGPLDRAGIVAALAAIGRHRRALRALQRRGRQLQPVEHAAPGGRLLALACRRRFRRWALRGRPEAVEHASPRLPLGRSEEHTSELQSLMRISYAVFCLKKKKKTNTTHHHKSQTYYQID